VSCPANVSAALATLPWVEKDSIKADRTSRKAKFTVTAKDQFDFEALKTKLADSGYPGAKLESGPKEG
jgi:hypothetical protein